MATVSNPATLQSVINTFGSAGTPTNLLSYRKGQTYVPDIAAYSGVSATQPALSSFAGLVYPFLNLPDYGVGGIILEKITNIIPATGSPEATFVRIYLNSDGTGRYAFEDYFSSGEVNFLSFTWLLSGTNSDYYAYMDTPSGDPFFTGSVATSLQLSTNRVWVLRARAFTNTSDSKILSSTLRIKDISGNDLITNVVSMSVSVDNGAP